MDFRRSGPLDERRRRVLMDEIAAPNEADNTEQAASSSKGPVRAYAPAVLNERQPRVTELLPTRPLWAACLILLGLTGIAAIEAIHIHAVTLPLKQGAEQLAALDARQRGSLATWYSAGMLMASAILAAVTFGVRSHRVDDYRGRYRVWLWAVPALAWLSIDAATGLHDAIGLGLTLLAGQQIAAPLPAACTATWIAIYALLLGTLGIRLAMEIWPSIPSFAALSVAALLYLFTGLFELGMLPAAASPLVASVVESTVAMLAHLSLLSAIGLYARHVLLDAGGRLKVHIDPDKKKPKAKSKAKLKVVKEDRDEPVKKPAASSPAAKPSQPAAGSSGNVSSSRPGASISKSTLNSPEDEDDEEDYGDDSLSKSERRRLKKMSRREQRRAA
jgi:hypothetical protein